MQGDHLTLPLGGQQEFRWLCDRLRNHGLFSFFTGIRKEWCEDHGDLILRLKTTALHSVFKQAVEATIQQELERLREAHPSLRPFIEKIRLGGHAEVFLHGDPQWCVPSYLKSPDGQLRFQGFKYPVLLFEVANNITASVLLGRLDELFRHVPEVQYVLAFHIDYPQQ